MKANNTHQKKSVVTEDFCSSVELETRPMSGSTFTSGSAAAAARIEKFDMVRIQLATSSLLDTSNDSRLSPTWGRK